MIFSDQNRFEKVLVPKVKELRSVFDPKTLESWLLFVPTFLLLTKLGESCHPRVMSNVQHSPQSTTASNLDTNMYERAQIFFKITSTDMLKYFIF